MKLTNKMRLPESIVRAVANDSYTKREADFSVTEILSPPQVVTLKNEHYEELEEDVADRGWSLLGQAVHSIVERGAEGIPDVLSELTLVTEVDGVKLKGTMDHITISRAELNDFKVTTAWKLKGGGVPTEWAQQTNIYRWMVWRERGMEINAIAIVAILRDWSKLEAARSPDYPQAQFIRLDVPLWTYDEVERFVIDRLNDLRYNPLRPCTDEERWLKPEKYAVMKRGADRAKKLCDSAAEASAWISGQKDASQLYVEHRPGEATRCLHYCNVAKFCKQFQGVS